MPAYTLKLGYTLTATASSAGGYIRQVEDATIGKALSPGFSASYGPYLLERNFVAADRVTVSIAEAAAASLGTLLFPNDGAPVNALQAVLTVDPAGDDNALTFTARAYGVDGNLIRIKYTDPGANGAALTVSVNGTIIGVSLATNGGGTITSTAAEVRTAIGVSGPANALVTVAIDTTDTGVADDGSGVVTAMALTALATGAGTGIGIAAKGCLCIDTTNANIYRNDGTQAVPVWVQLADVP